MKKISIMITILCAMALGLELLCRLCFPVPEISNFNRIFFSDPILFGSSAHPLRNVQFTWASEPDGYESLQTLNLYGFRGPDFKVQRSPGRKRILFFGDSFVEGFGADDLNTLPAHYSSLLQEKQDAEIINLGIGAASPKEYLQLANVAIPLLKPDEIFLVFFANDFPARSFQEPFTLNSFQPIYESTFNSRLAYVLRELLNHNAPAMFFPRGPFPFFLPVPAPSNPLTNASQNPNVSPKIWDAMKRGKFNPYVVNGARSFEINLQTELTEVNGPYKYLQTIKELSNSINSKLHIVYIPYHVTVSDFYYPLWNELGDKFTVPSLTGAAFRKHQMAIARDSETLHLQFIDTTSAIEAQEDRGIHLFHGYDEHMTGQGYRIVAEELFAKAG